MTELPKTATVDAPVVGDMTDGYPRAIPLWEGAQVASSDHITSADFEVYDLILITNDPLVEVLNGYLTTLQKAKYAIKQRDAGQDMVSVEASTTAHRASFLFSRNNLNQTEITISIRTYHE
jgi:hypothetical protein